MPGFAKADLIFGVIFSRLLFFVFSSNIYWQFYCNVHDKTVYEVKFEENLQDCFLCRSE